MEKQKLLYLDERNQIRRAYGRYIGITNSLLTFRSGKLTLHLPLSRLLRIEDWTDECDLEEMKE